MKADRKNTAVVVPIFNSAEYLEELFGKIFKFFPKENLFAVNDASEDRSIEICDKSDVNLINIPVNKGKGNALQIGFEKAVKKGFKFAFSIDSDLQHKPEDFPVFLNPGTVMPAGVMRS